jgi:chaperonin GroES
MNKILKPIGDRVLLKLIAEQSDKTEGGLYIPESAKVNAVKRAEVVAVGDGLYSTNGKLIPMVLSVGDIVVIPPYRDEAEVKLDGVNYLLMRENEILGIL